MHKSPDLKDLYSGKPKEWSPHDIDARLNRICSLGFSCVPKGKNANPKIRIPPTVVPEKLDLEKIRRLCEALPSLEIEYARETSASSKEEVVFNLRSIGLKKEEMRPYYKHCLKASGIISGLSVRLSLIESRTGRADLLISAEEQSKESASRLFSLQNVGFSLISESANHPHMLSRSIIGQPQLRVFQNISIGAKYLLETNISKELQTVKALDIVKFEPEVY